jgi:hypothetical protein
VWLLFRSSTSRVFVSIPYVHIKLVLKQSLDLFKIYYTIKDRVYPLHSNTGLKQCPGLAPGVIEYAPINLYRFPGFTRRSTDTLSRFMGVVQAAPGKRAV